jgi:hypothetical protein
MSRQCWSVAKKQSINAHCEKVEQRVVLLAFLGGEKRPEDPESEELPLANAGQSVYLATKAPPYPQCRTPPATRYRRSCHRTQTSQTQLKAFRPNYVSRPEDLTASLTELCPALTGYKSYLFFEVLADPVASVKRTEQEWKNSLLPRPHPTPQSRFSSLHREFADMPLYK